MPPTPSKSTLRPILISGLQQLEGHRLDAFMDLLERDVLSQKIKFPLLEWLTLEWLKVLPGERQVEMAERIVGVKAIGSYVMAGVILRERLPHDFAGAMSKARDFIISGDEWYVCDIIGERVPGYALLTMPKMALPELNRMARHSNKWIVRAVGVAAQLAVKWGLPPGYAEKTFKLLLSLADSTDFHTGKGVGWGAKTIARFHPDMVRTYLPDILDDPSIRPWFKRKLNIGLNLSLKDAERDTGKNGTE
ncbi:MAG TPA: DNA alkylation repair protein [Flavilitoribacter sp.]|nr:DNA alkylation repair protein [Flavilitoribacter sp.]HMQ86855.1 DNA alkylation repair protein [Flavilitoribacter sp.]